MTERLSTIEVLSPVGSKEMLIAAVRSGADAVYLGAKQFNARRNADNFDEAALKEAVDYCHIRGVKVYLTLNIQLKDSEISKAFSLAVSSYNMGIDALIIADLGLAKLLHEKLPLLPLHASTQMTVINEDSLPVLKKYGFTRVVAAREMSKAQLSRLCRKAKELNIEVEVFVHGALCMSVSGQCLMSALLGSRSGNRGLCAGPCRLPFDDHKGNSYALSLKDLSLLDSVDELKEMGVSSLKIEGRMKRPEYVASVTAAFKDMCQKGYVTEKIKECTENVFSRSGFTDGYFTENLGKTMFGIRTKNDVSSAQDTYPFLHEMIRHERQSVPINIYAQIKENEPMALELYDGTNRIRVMGDMPEKAINKPLDSDTVTTQLSKLGGTPYFARSINVDLDENISIKISSLNSIRRAAISILDEKRSEIKRETVNVDYIPSQIRSKAYNPHLAVRIEDLSLLPDDLSSVSHIFLPIEKKHNLASLESSITPVADIPFALFGEKLKEMLISAKEQGFKAVMIQNLAHLELAKESGLEIFAGHRMNVFSSNTLEFFKDEGISGAVISPELTAIELSKISPVIKKICFAYGKLPLMLTKNCPVSLEGCGCKGDRTVTDRMGVSFRVKCRMGYSELFADRPIWISDRLNEFSSDTFMLYFTDESKEIIEKVIKAYKTSACPLPPFTRGLYYRGVE